MKWNEYGLGILAALSLSGLAAATVHVKYLDSSNNQIGLVVDYSSSAAITVNINSSSIAKVMVYSDNAASDNIGTISVTGANTQSINLYVAQSQLDATTFYTNTSDAAGQDFGGIQGNSPSNREVHAKSTCWMTRSAASPSVTWKRSKRTRSTRTSRARVGSSR